MIDLKFKKGLYKYYAPWLFKIYKFKAYIFLLTKKRSLSNLGFLSQFFWDQYLSAKFREEISSAGERVFDGKIMCEEHQGKAYILGCGASINNLSISDWEKVGKSFSIGLNNFYIHDFVPNMYFCEYISNPEARNMFYTYLLNNEAKKNSKVFLNGKSVFIKGHFDSDASCIKPYFYMTDKIKTTNKNLLIDIVRQYFDGSKESWRLCHQMSNLDTVINYCARQGVKEICLVGIDLTDSGYFWDGAENEAYATASAFRKSINKQLKYVMSPDGKHATACSSVAKHLGNFTIVEYLEILQIEILSPMGIQMYVANPNSLLAAFLPCRPVSEFHRG
ncbi:hypothetical protein [Paraglaciecola hydrolytica]|uniref:Uncharacterized protein n=1 Tax=Paraglaciecola hydrolytica TaxID=1799789 RepID=A0A148KNW0_9ALTE|nr:hypothetical protein [Paraglaciecola hydrolytica]KXI27918.1 hypothetical protein AX660_20645 [Paraglaciecola hydrolytica]